MVELAKERHGGRQAAPALAVSRATIALMEAHAADLDHALAEGRVASSFEARIRALEAEQLSPLATQSYPALRAEPEEACRLRTPFQRDRDRIVHSKSFRRLKHKTQVFIAPEGDHYRTRLTHTLEACGISRTVARALRLNEDLAEAIGYGHDLGHPPFGHTGEQALDEVLQARFGRRFRHNEQSLRVVERLERGGRGLNLTAQVRDGILRPTGPVEPSTPEGKIVRLVDRIAYINHDIDDAVRAGVLGERDLPREEIAVLGETGSARIDLLVHDLVEHSEAAADIVQSELVGGAMTRLRKFMFERVYLGRGALREQDRVTGVIETLFEHHMQHPVEPQEGEGSEVSGEADLPTRVTDYIAGMTDRFCIRRFEELAIPREFRY
jgi:dGTPase